jgi:hypothetical protein
MFKRVAKRIKKREEEDRLGLDEEMKEVLGYHDTDSEESESASESDGESGEEASTSEGGEDDEDHFLARGLKKTREEDEQEQDEEAAGEDEEYAHISLPEALLNPIYTVSLSSDVSSCVACPGKLLKNSKMVEVHRASKVD